MSGYGYSYFSGGTFTFSALGPDGSAAAPTYSFVNDSDTGIYAGVGIGSAGVLCFASNGATSFILGNSVARFGSGYAVGWSSNADPTLATTDTALTRVAAGVVGITSGIAVGTNPASSGIIRLANAQQIAFRNAANNTDYNAIYVDASNRTVVGDANSGAVYFPNQFGVYKNVTVAGYGTAPIYASGRSTAQTGAVASVCTYTPTADGSFRVSANVLITASTTFTFNVQCTYTDEGNTARTLLLTFSNVGGTLSITIANAGGAVPYEGVPMHIRVKANTAITIKTAGTFTTVTYNVEGCIEQLA